MKVSVNRRLCAGHGLCAAAAPAVFKVNDDWIAEVLIEEPPESMREAVEKAARFCPVNAITIAGSETDSTEDAAADAQPGRD
jgi:ferredoxin